MESMRGYQEVATNSLRQKKKKKLVKSGFGSLSHNCPCSLRNHVLKHTAIERRRWELPLRGTRNCFVLASRSGGLRRLRPIAVCFSAWFSNG